MAYTVQNLLDRARIPLNDADKDRYTDADKLLPYAKAGLETAFRKRPDVFFGQYTALDFSTLVVGAAFPLPNEYLQVVSDYITARCEGVDDEHMSMGRAKTYYELFLAG